MKYCNLTLSLPLIGQSSSTRASVWPLSTVLQLLLWVSHELLFTDLRYLTILRLSGLIPRNYRTLALVRFDDTMIASFITSWDYNNQSRHLLRHRQWSPADPGPGDLTSHTRVYSLRGGWHLGQGFFCSNKICGFCLQHSFFTQDILRMTGGLPFREKRKKNWKQEAVREH